MAVALAHGDNNAALAGLIFTQTAIAAIFFVIPRLHVFAEIGAINLDLGLRQLRSMAHREALENLKLRRKKSRKDPAGRAHRKTGRPRGARVKATPALLKIAEEKIAAGVPQRDVARQLGLHYNSLYKHLGGTRAVRERAAEDAAVKEALEQGKDESST